MTETRHSVSGSASGILDAAKQLGAALKKAGACEFAGPCPSCGGRDRFSINTRKGLFNCRGCGVGGDAVDLVRHVTRVSYREALAFLGRDDGESRPRPLRASSDARLSTGFGAAAVANDDNDARRREAFISERVAAIVRELVPLRGTPGEAYLREIRRIDVDAVADVLERTDAIGWHPAVYFHDLGDDDGPVHPLHGKLVGCIVGVMTDPETAKPTGAISRTYLDEGRKVGKAKTLGSPIGIVRLDEDAAVTYGLGLAEGIETTLAVMAKGWRPCWSTGGKALMAAFAVLPVIQRLTLFADNDPDGVGLKAAQEAQARWRAAGCDARVRMAAKAGDLNDVREEDAP